MDEIQALLVIQSALGLARDYYQTLLMDKISTDSDYQEECGYRYLLLAMNSVFERIEEIENEQDERENE